MPGDGRPSFRYTARTFAGPCYAFVSACSDGPSAGTRCLQPGEVAPLPPAVQFVKITIMGYETSQKRAVPCGTAFISCYDHDVAQRGRAHVMDGQFVVVINGCLAKDVTNDVEKEVAVYKDKCDAFYNRRFSELGLTTKSATRPYVHTYMLECELPLKWRVPCIGGWPQMDSLSGLGAVEAAHSFSRCLHVAKAITRFDAAAASQLDAGGVAVVLDNLFASSLRVYAGVYPEGTENVDDRSLGCFKLCTNSDCDDMSITAAAFFNRLKRADCAAMVQESGPFGAISVLSHALATFDEVWCVQGLVQTSVAVPRAWTRWLWESKPSGHVWCMLKRHDGSFCHLECTRCVSTDPRTGTGGHSGCFYRHPVTEPLEAGLAGCDLSRYSTACAAYTANRMIWPVAKGHTTVGVPYDDLLHGDCRCMPVVPPGTTVAVKGRLAGLVDQLRHRPSHDQLRLAVAAAPPVFLHGHITSESDQDPPDGEQRLVYGALGDDPVCYWSVSPCVTWAGHVGKS